MIIAGVLILLDRMIFVQQYDVGVQLWDTWDSYQIPANYRSVDRKICARLSISPSADHQQELDAAISRQRCYLGVRYRGLSFPDQIPCI